MKIRGLGYIGLSVHDLRAWDDLLMKVGGLVPAADMNQTDCAHYRMDERQWRICLQKADSEGLAFMGWELATDTDFEEALRELHDAGLAVEMRDPKLRGVAAIASSRDPAGNLLEFYYGAKVLAKPLALPFDIEGFKTGALGLGHVLLSVDDCEIVRDFYTKQLGMRLTDYTQLGPKAAYFLRCNSRHHTVAMTNAFPSLGLNHFLLEMDSLDDVGRAYDRALDYGVPIINGLGRHRNDRTISFYMKTPSGFGLEIGCGGLEIDEANWISTEFEGGGVWGHRGTMNDELRAQGRKKA